MIEEAPTLWSKLDSGSLTLTRKKLKNERVEENAAAAKRSYSFHVLGDDIARKLRHRLTKRLATIFQHASLDISGKIEPFREDYCKQADATKCIGNAAI